MIFKTRFTFYTIGFTKSFPSKPLVPCRISLVLDMVGSIVCLSNFSFLLLTSTHNHINHTIGNKLLAGFRRYVFTQLVSSFYDKFENKMALLHVNCYRGIYTYIQYFAVLSTLPQPVGEANKGETFTRRENKFCSIGYYIDVDKNQGWVDYKSFVVRYNYSYFKNM